MHAPTSFRPFPAAAPSGPFGGDDRCFSVGLRTARTLTVSPFPFLPVLAAVVVDDVRQGRAKGFPVPNSMPNASLMGVSPVARKPTSVAMARA